MARPYSYDLRQKAVEAVLNGAKLVEVSELFGIIAKHTKVDMIWVAGRSPTLVSHSLRGVAMNLKATTLTYLSIVSEPYKDG
jgi:uncharacterized membrane protein